ncbi:DUF2207 domain-containing protein [bacterium]|nr:DUF2207 domain-containing protein [bacterium]
MIKRWCRLLIVAVLFLSPGRLRAQSLGGYQIDNFDIEIDIQENNTFRVQEKIAVDFDQPRHGIYRSLSLAEQIARLDGSSHRRRVRYSDIVADTTYQINRSGDELTIKLGDADRYLTGKQTFVIDYTYNPGVDPLKDADEVYYNLVGTGWDVPISEASFSVTLPKDFDASSLGFSVGQYGRGYNDRVVYQVVGRTITGHVIDALAPGEAVTMRLTLPDGYFVGAGFGLNTPLLVVMLAILAGAGVCVWWWHEHGRDEPVVETVEFYPPAGLNSAEVGVVYHGGLTTDAKVSLLVYLADRGYLKIIDTGERGRRSFRLEKLKDYDGDNPAEKLFMDGLFAGGRRETKASDLQDKFYQTLNRVTTMINHDPKVQSWWEQSTQKYRWLALLLAGGGLLLAFVVPMWQNYQTLESVIFAMIVFVIMAISIAANQAPKMVAAVVSCLGIGLVALWLIEVGSLLVAEPVSLALGLGCLLGVGVMVVTAVLMGKPSPLGTQLIGQVRGFRRFLATAEKNKLEALVKDNPSYFYNILPFTFALGVSDTWVRQFRDIALEPPEWYSSPTAFDVVHFSHFMNNTVSSAKSAMTSSPSSSGTGSSGGGFSGGGGGGGVGGSW